MFIAKGAPEPGTHVKEGVWSLDSKLVASGEQAPGYKARSGHYFRFFLCARKKKGFLMMDD
jgi:hypothetical protein